MGRVFSGLFNGFHFFLATRVVEGTDNDRLPKEDVAS